MGNLRSELDADIREKAEAELTSQVNRAFEELLETSRKLSQHSFLVNSGGAAAILAYMSTNPDALFAFLPLVSFLMGVIASGLELRFLRGSLTALHKDAINRRSEFITDQVPLDKAVPAANTGSPYGKLSAWSGIVAQAAFPLGVILGITVLFRSSAA